MTTFNCFKTLAYINLLYFSLKMVFILQRFINYQVVLLNQHTLIGRFRLYSYDGVTSFKNYSTSACLHNISMLSFISIYRKPKIALSPNIGQECWRNYTNCW